MKNCSIESKDLLHSDISSLHYTKLFILKIISSIFILIYSPSFEIVHVYSTCIKNHSRILSNVTPYLHSDHEAHNNDLLYQECPYHMWQVPIPNFQEIHPDHCYPLYQRHSFRFSENHFLHHQCFIHNRYHFHRGSNFLFPPILLLLWKVCVHLQW